MEIRVHGHHVQVNERVRTLAEEKVGHAARFFDGQASTADVEFFEEGNPRLADVRSRVEITAPVAGHVVRVEAAAQEAQEALDLAVAKFERQLRKLKDRLITKARKSDKRLNQPTATVDEERDTDASSRIVRVKQFTIKPMTPEEAALQMEMLNHSFFFFLNAESDEYAVLYRRDDGQLGLIEPS